MSKNINLMDMIYYLFIALYPIAPDFCQIGKYSLNTYILYCFLVLKILIKHRIYKKRAIFIIKAYFPMIFLMLIPMLRFGERSTIIDWVISPIVIIYLIIQWCDSSEKINKSIKILINVGMIMCILGFIESFTRFNVFSLIQTIDASEGMGALAVTYRYGRIRIEGSLGQPIPFGLYLAFINFLCIYRMYNTEDKRVIDKVTYVLSIVCVYLTGTRIALLMVFLLLLYYWFTMVSKYKPLILMLSICGVVFYFMMETENSMLKDAIYGILAALGMNVANRTTDGAGTALYRMSMFNYLKAMIFDKLWIGMGYLKSIEVEVPVNDVNGTWYQHSIDNNYLVWWLRYGLIGMAGNLYFILCPLYFVKKQMKTLRVKLQQQQAKILLLWIIGYASALFTVYQMGEKRIFIITSALIMAQYYIRKNEKMLSE